MGRNHPAGALDRTQIGPAIAVDRRGHGDGEEGRALQIGGSIGKADRRSRQLFRGDFAGPILVRTQRGDAAAVDIDADNGFEVLREGNRQGQPDVT